VEPVGVVVAAVADLDLGPVALAVGRVEEQIDSFRDLLTGGMLSRDVSWEFSSATVQTIHARGLDNLFVLSSIESVPSGVGKLSGVAVANLIDSVVNASEAGVHHFRSLA